MTADTQSNPANTPQRFHSILLLFCLILYMAIAPLIEEFARIRVLTDLFFSGVMLSTIIAVSRRRRQWVIAAILSFPLFFATWEGYIEPLPNVMLVGHIFEVLFFAYTAGLFLKAIFLEGRVDLNVISSAIVVYMFIGFMWAGLYQILEHMDPGSFSVSQAIQEQGLDAHFHYFSFVTLTTLGYGDITPVSHPARNFAVLEAFIGQVYLTVLVARLVGTYIAQSGHDRYDS
jgi:hypothetical protein